MMTNEKCTAVTVPNSYFMSRVTTSLQQGDGMPLLDSSIV